MTIAQEFILEHSGKGTIKVIGEDISVEVGIHITLNYAGRVEVKLRCPIFGDDNLNLLKEMVDKQLTKCELKGTLSDNAGLHIPEFYVQTFTISMKQGETPMNDIIIFPHSDIFIWEDAKEDYQNFLKEKHTLSAGLVNFLFGGVQVTKHPDGSMRRDVFSVDMKPFKITFRHLPEYSEIEKFVKKEKTPLVACEAAVEDISYNDFLTFMDSVQWLLSYSQKTHISRQYTKFLRDEKVKLTVIHQCRKHPFANSRFIEASNLRGDYISPFLQESYAKFESKREELKLDNVIDIMCQAEIAPVLETKFLLLCTALELLVEKICSVENLKVDDDLDVVQNSINAIAKYLRGVDASLSKEDTKGIAKKLAHKTFKERIRAVNTHFSMGWRDEEIMRVKQSRDKIVHEVRFKDYERPVQDFNQVKLFLDRLLIKILEYTGPVLNYTKEGYPLETLE